MACSVGIYLSVPVCTVLLCAALHMRTHITLRQSRASNPRTTRDQASDGSFGEVAIVFGCPATWSKQGTSQIHGALKFKANQLLAQLMRKST